MGRVFHRKTIDTVEALDKETLDKESRVWNPVELQLWIGQGYRHRPHQIRNPPGSGLSGGHSLSNAPAVVAVLVFVAVALVAVAASSSASPSSLSASSASSSPKRVKVGALNKAHLLFGRARSFLRFACGPPFLWWRAPWRSWGQNGLRSYVSFLRSAPQL